LASFSTSSYGSRLVFVWKDSKQAALKNSQPAAASSQGTEDWTARRPSHIVVVAHLADTWKAYYSCQSTLASYVPTPPEVFTHGDRHLMLKSSSAQSGSTGKSVNSKDLSKSYVASEWPSSVVVNVTAKVSDTGLRPINYTFNMFRMSLASSSACKEAMKYVGTIPNVAMKTPSQVFDVALDSPIAVDSCWIRLKTPESDIPFALNKDGPFLPASIQVRDCISSLPDGTAGSSVALTSDVLVVGCALSPKIVEVVNADMTKSVRKVSALDR
jgi:hypothetical protein